MGHAREICVNGLSARLFPKCERQRPGILLPSRVLDELAERDDFAVGLSVWNLEADAPSAGQRRDDADARRQRHRQLAGKAFDAAKLGACARLKLVRRDDWTGRQTVNAPKDAETSKLFFELKGGGFQCAFIDLTRPRRRFRE
jgi:hypothetical protein